MSVSAAELRLFEEISTIVGEGRLTPVNITGITIAMMQIAEDPSFSLTGREKKDLIIKVLDTYVDKEINDVQFKVDLKLLVHSTIPPLIDSLVGLSKGDILIKGKKCVERLFCC